MKVSTLIWPWLYIIKQRKGFLSMYCLINAIIFTEISFSPETSNWYNIGNLGIFYGD